MAVVRNMPNEYEKNFSENERTDQPYKLKTPLHEMDFDEYGYYFKTLTAPVGLDYSISNKTVLPCDVEYYALQDDSEPILTLKKGTEVCISSEKGEIPIGYGLKCWPDYEKGWRYGYAFLSEDFEDLSENAQKYYVKSKQLEKVAIERYKNNKDVYGIFQTEKEYVQSVTQEIDEVLYFNGAYLSNYLIER
jgi:hypothetical protein